jgi:hypothetical protein
LIRSKWRDDGEICLLQNATAEAPLGLKIFQQANQQTSSGREESHVMVELTNAETCTTGMIPYDSELEQEASGQSDGISLTLEVPEKININCDLSNGGSVVIQGKIEGDVRVRVVGGDVKVQKLRGHSIEIEIIGTGNLYSSDLLEAQDISVRLPSSGRFRAKRIHARSSHIRIVEPQKFAMSSNGKTALFDSDDTGAVCDISSYYITGDANIDVECSPGETRQAIRVKAHHGHLTARASAPMPTRINANADDRFPIADIGGVNGSCEVSVNGFCGVPSEAVSCRVHFDSLLPDSVSIIQADSGSIHMTLDRKVESDLRMLSTSKVGSVDVDMLLLDKDDDEVDDLYSMLDDIDTISTLYGKVPIQVKTKAFSAYSDERSWENIRFVDGWVENRSEEPDSRFDRKLRGETGSMGKISSNGATNQALHNFQGEGKSTFIRPIVAAVGSSIILVETLSWLGNIARRYGLDETRTTTDLGRTATRRGRPLDPL